MSTKRIYNFGAGPSMLPLEVLDEVKNGFMEFGGMSVLEISHRSKQFEAILSEARDLMCELMGVPKGYHCLFLQGGASLQFAMIPMNLMDKSADYAVTGVWAKKAADEAKIVGDMRKIFSSEETGFNRVPTPSELKTTEGTSYLHITTNNTIHGTEYSQFPDTGKLTLVADMSSDILARKVDVSKFGLIYAGAQKNVGAAGATIVIIRDDIAKISYRKLPMMLRYSAHVDTASLFNTPPVFSIYITLLVLRWLKKTGGVEVIEKMNREKAAIIYNVLDSSNFYKGVAEKKSRSIMNVSFTLPSEELTERFIAEAKEHNMTGLKGHRSAGGIRASIYNAFPRDGVETLANFMKEFERKQ